jgi:4-amino-4-deoxy-L-arabinose transferase-like glycosyltransferase
MALTPVAVLMFRFDNPDALLVLLLTAAGYATVRAVEVGRLRWLIGAGVLIGFAFLTKTLQAVLVVPGFALVYLVAAPVTLRRRIVHLLAAGAAMVVAGGWWGGDRRAGPGLGAALHRRIADQLGVGADLGLQRPRAADR